GVGEGDGMERVIKAEAKASGRSEEEVRQNSVRYTAMKTFVTPQDIANMILFLCSNKNAHVSSQALPVDGYLYTLGDCLAEPDAVASVTLENAITRRTGAMTKSGAANGWGVNSEYGKLHDVLLCEPVNFKWLPTSSISKATLRSGAKFDRQLAMRQHREMV